MINSGIQLVTIRSLCWLQSQQVKPLPQTSEKPCDGELVQYSVLTLSYLHVCVCECVFMVHLDDMYVHA